MNPAVDVFGPDEALEFLAPATPGPPTPTCSPRRTICTTCAATI
jgi:hypothetical protein